MNIEHGQNEPWALTWSPSQRCLHKEPLSETMATGLAMLRCELGANDYLLLYVGPESAVHEMARELQPLVDGHRLTPRDRP